MRLLLLIATLTLFSFANEKFFNMKSCETLQLSKLTALVSCHNIDYLIEYRNIDDEERDRIKKNYSNYSK